MKKRALTLDYINKCYVISYKDNPHICLLDPEDFERFKDENWCYRCGYVSRSRRVKDGVGSNWIHLHREVLFYAGIEIPKGMVVDHINRNKMDNRKSNLRVVSQSINALNVSGECTEFRRENVKKATIAAASKPKNEKQRRASSNAISMINKLGLNIFKGDKNYISKKIIDTSTGLIFSCIREAAEYSGMKYSTLKSQINGTNPNKTTFTYYEERKA